MAFITSKGTLDKQNSEVRKYIAERAELIGAIRLPNNAFLANAGTKVTTDVIFLQKRDKLIDVSMPEADSGLEWLHLGRRKTVCQSTSILSTHPEMVLGEMDLTTACTATPRKPPASRLRVKAFRICFWRPYRISTPNIPTMK